MAYQIRKNGRLGLLIDGKEIEKGTIIEIETHTYHQLYRGIFQEVTKSVASLGYNIEFITEKNVCTSILTICIQDITKGQAGKHPLCDPD